MRKNINDAYDEMETIVGCGIVLLIGLGAITIGLLALLIASD